MNHHNGKCVGRLATLHQNEAVDSLAVFPIDLVVVL